MTTAAPIGSRRASATGRDRRGDEPSVRAADGAAHAGAVGARPARRRRCRGASARTGRAWLVGLVVLVAWMVVALVLGRGCAGSPIASTPRSCAPSPTPAHGLADQACPRHRPGGDRVDDVRRRHRADRRDGGVPRWRHLFTFLGSVARARGARAPADRRVPAAAAVRRHDDRALARVLAAVGAGGDRVVHRRRDHLHAGRARPAAHDRQGRRRRRRRVCRARRGCTSAWTTPSTSSSASRFGVAIPLNAFRFFTPNEVVPGHATTAARRPTSTSAAGAARPSARPFEDQLGVTVVDDQAGRPRRLGRLDAAAPAPRRRPRHVRVREALRDEPRARRPLVQARADDPVRAPRGRGAVPVGPPPRAVRGLRAAADARRRHPDGRRRSASSS